VPEQTVTEPLYRSKPWQIAVGSVLASLIIAFAYPLIDLFSLWTTADYSHGFLVIPFIGYLLYRWRNTFPTKVKWPDSRGLPFFVLALVAVLVGDRYNIAREAVQSVGFLIGLLGIVVMFCGRWAGLRWAGPALFMLLLTFQLPHAIERDISMKLRSVATEAGNFTFQTLGLATYTEGNRILGAVELEVAQACSGLSMLLAFLAMAAGIVAVYDTRPWLDRIFVLLSAVPIAIACNVIRIILTGLVYYMGWKKLGDLVVHDMAGWMMMPMALGMLWLVFRMINWIAEPVERVTATEALGLHKFKANSVKTHPTVVPEPKS
jgi:exosortase